MKLKKVILEVLFSILEILFVIFKKYKKKNFFVLSKGHASIGVYAIMYHFKLISKIYSSFCRIGLKTRRTSRPTKLPILNFSTGSFGHGLPNLSWLCLRFKIKKNKKKNNLSFR